MTDGMENDGALNARTPINRPQPTRPLEKRGVGVVSRRKV